MPYEQELAFAKSVALEAGAIMQKYYRIEQQVTVKDDDTPVTIADTQINSMLIERVKNEYAADGVMGEEENWHADRDRVWVCDPIDGTVAYIIKVPTSMFALALVEDGKPVVAVAYNPWVDELYSATLGGGAFRNDTQIYVSAKKWGESTHIGASCSRIGNIFGELELVASLLKQKVYVNSAPGLTHAGCTLAEGAIEGRIFTHHTAHDVAALKLLIEEAGGRVTDLDGNEQRYDRPVNGAILSNGHIHEELIKVYHENSRH